MIRYLKLSVLVLLLSACATSRQADLQSTSRPDGAKEPLADYLDFTTPDDSGMWMLPQIRGAVHTEMTEKGLILSSDELYDPDRPSLNQAIVRINIGERGGGTGSFVSSRGLILTNHHVAYDAIASASSADQNWLEEGFYAEAAGDEIPAEEYSLYIPIVQKEVTGEIESRLDEGLSYGERAQQEQQIRQELIDERQDGDRDLLVEIDDYWAGNRQFMAVYRIIRDVRLVHAPPSSIGKYGGDIDNWMWPRHTGDYALLRAYVAPDGSGAAFDESNVPFKPERHLAINAGGIQPGDFTMVLGFPGSTYRYESSYAFDFYENYRNDILISSFRAIFEALETEAEQDEEQAVETASDRASFANTLKYFEGIQEGFKKYRITGQKREQEEAFKNWIEEDENRLSKYGEVLAQLEQAYSIASQSGDLLFASVYPLNYSAILQTAALYTDYYTYLGNPDSLSFSDEDRETVLEQHREMLENFYPAAENQLLADMLQTIASLPEGKVPLSLLNHIEGSDGEELHENAARFLAEQQEESFIYDADKAEMFLNRPVDEVSGEPKDPIVELYEELVEAYEFSRENYAQHFRYLETAEPLYVEGMMAFRSDSTGYPDANFTLRLSGGRVMGYKPADGTFSTPFTTFEGMTAKDTDEEPFDAPQELENYQQALADGDTTASRYATGNGHLVVNFLSTNDITGGNSGSPVLDGNGNVVGLAFDGNIEGVVGDYFFDPDLNRTISVDIRYILFLLDDYFKADRLMEELKFSEQ